ncbi:HNH endonuclease [Alcanivorax sp. JB21]|uniref:HNH endonuclease n=1 Tax=Alcanivorax limicola TaxID=2874102 RepID=UPI001CBE74A7|nr:HNH endonuclease [Alcanivorax limicola]MBZ2188663.1 HNH endonuclease [Alcanivorax limicola]MBZ2190593.1 HNH endonuclease [Alcanivorax limicola]
MTSTTVPPLGGRNVLLTGQRYPVTGIVFDRRGFPIFDDVARFDTRLPVDQFRGASYTQQMQMATSDLAEAVGRGQVRTASFTDAQLQQIRSGSPRIDGYSWHHHQDTGRMQLVPRDIHKRTGHLGWEGMSQGR